MSAISAGRLAELTRALDSDDSGETYLGHGEAFTVLPWRELRSLLAAAERADRLAGLLREWFQPHAQCWGERSLKDPDDPQVVVAPQEGCDCWPCRVAREVGP